MPSGAKILCSTNLSSGIPDATSTTCASTSKPYCGLYAQCVPGWKSSGIVARRGKACANVSPLPTANGYVLLAPPLMSPDVCDSKSRIMTGRSAGTTRPGCGADAVNAGDGGTKPSVLGTVTVSV